MLGTHILETEKLCQKIDKRIKELDIYNRELKKTLEEISNYIKKVKDVMGDASFLKDVVTSGAENKLANLEKAKEVLEEVKRRGAEVLRGALSSYLGCVPRLRDEKLTIDYLYELYKNVDEVMNNITDKEKIKIFICNNITIYKLTLEDLLAQKNYLWELDSRLKYFHNMKFKFAEIAPREVLWNNVKSWHISKLRNDLIPLSSLLEYFVNIDIPNFVTCRYSTVIALRLCKRFNDSVEYSIKILDGVKKALLDKGEIDLIKELEKLKAEYDNSIKMLQKNVERMRILLNKLKIAETEMCVEDILRRIDEEISKLNLTPIQQSILDELNEREEVSIKDLVGELLSRSNFQLEVLLRELYNLCEMGLVECMVKV